MTRSIPNLGDFELHVLQLVWEHEPCMERQISDLVRKQRPVARTTVLKTMQRLEAKGLLVREEGENAHPLPRGDWPRGVDAGAHRAIRR